MKKVFCNVLVFILFLSLALPQGTVNAYQPSGGVNVFTGLPQLICVGDTIPLEGAAGADYPPSEPTGPGQIPLAPLVVLNLQISATHGVITPPLISKSGDFMYFSFTYKATTPGDDVIKLNLNNGLATSQLSFTVQKSCDYDAFLLTVMNFTSTKPGFVFRSVSRITGMGTMKRLRSGEQYLQGDGKWDLEEDILSKPPDCVQYYTPPVIASGPFDLDGKLDADDETVDTIVAMQPSGKPTFHGISTCIEANGSVGKGWGIAMGGDPDLAAKIQTTFPISGGTQQVELQGGGMNIVQSVGDVEYFAQLTLVPR